MKKYMFGLLALSVVAGALPTAAQIDELSSTSILVCRSHQCADAPYSMTKGFLFNKIAQMVEQNTGKTVLLCEADPATHVCLAEGLTVPATTSYAPVRVTLQQLKLADEKKLNGATGLDLVFDYKIKAGRTYPSCQLALSRLMVNYTDKVEMTTQDFLCNMTETGQTSLNATYNIDYLDFDYGFIGAYYTIGIGGAVRGDKTGYAMFRFTTKPPVETQVEEVVVMTEPVVQKVEVPVSAPAKPAAEAKPVQVVPEIVIRQESASAKETETPAQPTVVKTTTVEKMVITSDGKRQVTPPEVRTIVDGKIQ